MSDTQHKQINFSDPGIYHIRVQGNVRQELWDYFEGETGQIKKDESGQVITTLKIQVHDQAELSGLINLLYDWRLVLLSVKMDGLLDEAES